MTKSRPGGSSMMLLLAPLSQQSNQRRSMPSRSIARGADPRASGAPVLPGADEQLLVPSSPLGSAMLPHTQVVAEGTTQEDIVPAAYVQGRDGDAGVILLDGQVLPVVIAAWMDQPVIEVVDQTVLQVGKLLEGQAAGDGKGV